MQYTLAADRGGVRRVVLRVASDAPATLRLSANGRSPVIVSISRADWRTSGNLRWRLA